MENTEFIKLRSSIIPSFNGEYGKLNAFLASIEMMSKFIKEDQEQLLVIFLKSRITGLIANRINSSLSVESIVNELKNCVKQESSDAIIGRLMSLRIENHDLIGFVDRVDGFSNKLIETLCLEGVPRKYATKMTITYVKDLCRSLSKNLILKVVVAASTYDTPIDVTTEFLLEIVRLKEETGKIPYKNNYTLINNNFTLKKIQKEEKSLGKITFETVNVIEIEKPVFSTAIETVVKSEAHSVNVNDIKIKSACTIKSFENNIIRAKKQEIIKKQNPIKEVTKNKKSMSNYDVIKEPIKKLIYLRLELKPILKHLMADFIKILKIFLLICMSSTQNALQVKKKIDDIFSYFDKLDYVRPKICSKWPPDKISY